MNITTNELKRLYLDFFKQKGHIEIPSASLIPENDPSALFTMAGMHPLVPYLIGERHPQGKRLVNCQKCLRTVDIEEVGNQWHLTFFEMLGNWSLGDYWKKEAITWSYEFLTQSLKINPNKLAVTIFAEDQDAPLDHESFNLWKKVGILEERIYKYGKNENWWGPVGETGPCGPCTEMFFIRDQKACGPSCQPKCQCGKYVEIWNDVFMEYNKQANGSYKKVKQKNVDTGMGVERTVAILNGYEDNYQVDTLKPIIEQIEKVSELKYQDNKKAFRIIADHMRAACFILAEEIIPSNLEQGYVLRRLIRTVISLAKKLNIAQEKKVTTEVAKIIINLNKDSWPEVGKNKKIILNELYREEIRFKKTLEKGLKEFNKWYKEPETYWTLIKGKEEKAIKKSSKKPKRMPGFIAFRLVTTYGFPLELVLEIAKEKGIIVDIEDYKKEFKKHQELSRAGAIKRFKGGLAETSEETKKLHTATHLLQAALRQILGDHVYQKGSNITTDRLRFDFPHPEKLSDDELKKIENLVNNWIKQGVEVKCEEMFYQEAKKQNITGLFIQKYGTRVKAYKIGEISAELCGGPHIKNTKELGQFKIKKQESVGSGIRRIKAILI